MCQPYVTRAQRATWQDLLGFAPVYSAAPMPVFIDARRHLPGLLVMAAGAVIAGLLYDRLTAR